MLQVCCGIVVPAAEYAAHCRHTEFENYLFLTPSKNYILPLGIGCLFNHSETPSVDYRVQEAARTVTFVAARDVAVGEELR